MNEERWKRLEELFHRGIAASPEARLRLVEEACGSDEELRREALALLASHESSGGAVSNDAIAALAASLTDAFDRPLTGRTLGPYKVGELLGEGGMGRVYRAVDTRLKRTVAFKALPSELVHDPEHGEKLLAEAVSASAINHPNVVTIYDAGEADEVRFIAMEYVEGETLRERIARGTASAAETASLGAQAAEGLAAAHERGIVHRDIKPANLIVSGSGLLKVLDFGLAKARRIDHDSASSASGLATGPRPMHGTLDYASPEQLRGDRVDARSDLFSLGLTLAELWTGRRPFEAATLPDSLAAVLRGEPDLTSGERSPAAAALEAFLRRLLAKDPDQRPETAGAVAAELREIAAGRSSIGGRSLLTRRRLAAALGLTACAAAAWGIWMPPDDPDPVESIAVLPLHDLSPIPGEEYFADSLTAELINRLASTGALRVTSRGSVMRFKDTTRSLAEVSAELGVDALLEGTVLRSGDRVRITAQLIDARSDSLLWAKTYDRRLAAILDLQYEVARDVVDQISNRLSEEQATRLRSADRVSPDAYETYLRGRYMWNLRTADDLRMAIDYFERVTELAPTFALSYVGLADSYSLLTAYTGQAPEQTYPRSAAAARQAIDLDPSLGEAWAALAVVEHEYKWRHAEAESHFLKAIALNKNYAPARQWYAEFLVRLRRSGEAVDQIRAALELDPLSLIVQSVAGWVYRFAGMEEEAIRMLRAVVAAAPDFAPAHGYLGRFRLERNQLEEAVDSLQRAYELSGRSSRYLADLGVAQAKSQRILEAEQTVTELEALTAGNRASPLHPANVLIALGRVEEAFPWLERAVEARGVWALFLNFDPLYEPLRGQERFDRLLARLGVA